MDRSTALTLRPACRADAGAIAAMSRTLIERGLGWRYTPARVERLIADAGINAVVAEGADGIAGFALMAFGDEDGHLTLLAVQPAQQRRGVARALVEWLLASARVAGLRTVVVELRIDNFGALALYRSLGFIETGLDPDYYSSGIGARRMTLELRPRGK